MKNALQLLVNNFLRFFTAVITLEYVKKKKNGSYHLEFSIFSLCNGHNPVSLPLLATFSIPYFELRNS